MPEENKNNSRSKWIGIVASFVSFGVGILTAAFVLGSARAKIQDVLAWKMEMAPRIERMDRQGSISFENFKTQYEKEQAQQYQQLKELSLARYDLEKRIAQMGELDARIKRVEDNLSHVDVLETEHRRLTKDFEDLKDDRRREQKPKDGR